MRYNVIIKALYFENYNNVTNESNNDFNWKPKNTHEFIINMDADLLMYYDGIEVVFQKMLDKHGNHNQRFKYISHKIRWENPTVLGTEEEFMELSKQIS